MTITARQGQTVFDIAVMVYGHTEGILYLMIDNGDKVFQEDITGEAFSVRDDLVIDKKVVDYFDQSISIVTF